MTPRVLLTQIIFLQSVLLIILKHVVYILAGTSSAGCPTIHTLDVLNDLQLGPSSSSFANDHLGLKPPQSCKKKALLVGVESLNGLRPLRGPHNDIREMRRFLIGKFD